MGRGRPSLLRRPSPSPAAGADGRRRASLGDEGGARPSPGPVVPFYEGLTPVPPEDEATARWLVDRGPPLERDRRAPTVATLTPACFARYVRVDHVHKGIEGLIPPEDGEALVEALRRLTPSDAGGCVFLIWDGYGIHQEAAAWVPGRLEAFGGRCFYAYQGPLRAWNGFRPPEDIAPHQTANYWWREERRWLVVTDVDASFSIVALTESGDVEVITARFRL